MAFTTATVTHTFQNADNTPASGAIEFTLTKRITNGSTTLIPSSITASLSSTGVLSQALTSNADTGTLPTDSQWRVDFRVLGAEQETFYITVPAGGGTIDLGTLLSQQPLGG